MLQDYNSINMDIAVTSVIAEQLFSGELIQSYNNSNLTEKVIKGQLNLPEYQSRNIRLTGFIFGVLSVSACLFYIAYYSLNIFSNWCYKLTILH
jgi:hypothetical protein